MVSVSVHNLVKRYGAQKAVNEVSFQLTAGSVTGFLGPNGAGKSSCLKMLAGLLASSSGEITVLGERMDTQAVRTKRHIGFLAESNPLYEDMYIKEALSFWARVLRVNNRKNRIEHVIDQVGLRSHVQKRVRELSKGYRQRVGIAQAILHDPEVLILDEPISGLDPNQLIDIRQLIRSLAVDKTIIYSTHILQEVEATCDRVLILNEGRLIADKSSEELYNIKTGQQRVRIMFEQAVDKQTIIANLPNVMIESDEQSLVYVVKNMGKVDMRKEILERSYRLEWPLLEIHDVKSDFNELFNELTK